MDRRLTGTVAVLAISLSGLAGCGGSSSSNNSSNFKSGYESAVTQLRVASTAIGTAVQGASKDTDATLGTSFKALATKWQSAVSQLETLKPPSSVAAPFNTLTAAAGRVETDLNSIVAAAATHSQSAGEQAGASLVTDITAARAADQTIKQKLGIKISG
jgi:hypothetical protein